MFINKNLLFILIKFKLKPKMEKNIRDKLIDDFTEKDEVKKEFEVWNYREELQIIGTIKGKIAGLFGENFIIEDANNQEVILPNLTALNSLLVNAKVGDKIKVVYQGSEKSKKTGRTYENFKVFIKEN